MSENKDITIDRVQITDAVKPDSHGLLHWKMTLKPKEKRQFRVAYRVEYPSELVLETRRRRNRARAMKRRMRRSPAQQNSAYPHVPRRKKYRIGEQLADLESAL